MLKVKASRVDKLQVELSSQRERLEEASRLTAKLKVSPCNHHIVINLNLAMFLGSRRCKRQKAWRSLRTRLILTWEAEKGSEHSCHDVDCLSCLGAEEQK